MAISVKTQKKNEYFKKLIQLVQAYPRILIVQADHVGSKQMAAVRTHLRGKAIILMGKNTMMKTALRGYLQQIPQLEKLINCVKLNIGFIFCIGDLAEIRKIILENKVPAPAKQGVLAKIDVFVPAGPTSMDPSQTSFFQALGIATKIMKGQIEIQNEVHLFKAGERVTASQSALLKKLNINPFAYGLEIKQIYEDGFVYDAAALDITDEDIIQRLQNGVMNVAALSLQTGMPTPASVPHSLIQAFKNCTAIALESDYVFPQMETLKNYFDNPSAFLTAAPAVTSAPAAKETVKEESEEEDDGDMGLSMFD